MEESCVSVIMSAKKEESLTETIMNYYVKENPDNIIGWYINMLAMNLPK